jgi:hypothetical protein
MGEIVVWIEWHCEPSLCDCSGTAHTKWKRHHQKETEHISDPTQMALPNGVQITQVTQIASNVELSRVQ